MLCEPIIIKEREIFSKNELYRTRFTLDVILENDCNGMYLFIIISSL
jgi:hypothetical protein